MLLASVAIMRITELKLGRQEEANVIHLLVADPDQNRVELEYPIAN